MERHTRSYLQLIKPGITLSNTLTALAGFLLALSATSFSWKALVGGVLGTALIIASACVVNNIIDRHIDEKMARTRKREVAVGKIGVPNATVFAVVLGLAGFALLLFWTNVLTFGLGALAYIWYVVIYGYAKRTTAWSTIIGGVPGALPIVAGYTALTGVFDGAAIVLFLVMFFWQIPHFYAISIFRRDDYAKAGLPVWSVVHGVKGTKRQILGSAIFYMIVSLLPTLMGYTGVIYAVVSLALGGYWVYKGVTLYNKLDDDKWARMMFGISLLILLALCVLVAVGGYLP